MGENAFWLCPVSIFSFLVPGVVNKSIKSNENRVDDEECEHSVFCRLAISLGFLFIEILVLT